MAGGRSHWQDIALGHGGATVIGVVRDVATTAIGGTNPLEYYLPIATAELPD